MNRLKRVVSLAALVVGLVGVSELKSVEVVGVGTEFLLGGDLASDDFGLELTDLDNDGDEFLYFGEDELGGYDAIFFSSDEPGFEGGEFAYNVFDNVLGAGNAKWCCGTQFPQIVGAQIVTDGDDLDTAYVLTHFTVSSANDIPGRDPVKWRIEGCNGCDLEDFESDEWEVIFSEEDLEVATEELGLDPFGPIWTQRFEVIRFDAGEDYDEPDAYSQFRMVTEETSMTAGAFFQIGEIEFFGEEDSGCPGLEAVIQATPAQGEQPLEVLFDGSQSKTTEACGAINRYEWKIDGDDATGAQVSRTFGRFGNKPVQLKVKTERGLGSRSVKSSVAVDFRKGPVAPFTSTELGEAAVSGGARMQDDCVVVGAGGKGFLTQSDTDSFQFVHLKLTGDFSITARIRSVSLAPKSLSVGGIMARASMDLDSPLVMVGIRQRDDVLQPLTRRRTRAGRRPLGKNVTDEVEPPAFYVRLDRTGDEFGFFTSVDGTNWDDLEGRTREVDLPDEVVVGLFASAEDASEAEGKEHTVEITFCELNGFPGGPDPSGFRRGDADGNGELQLADAIFLLNHLFAGGPAYTCADAADTDNNGGIDQTDVIAGLLHLFAGGAAPPAPGIEACGPDPEPDDGLGCDSYTSC